VLDIELRLEEWQTAGVIDADIARRLRGYEASRKSNASDASGRPGLLEALSYLGIAIVAVGVFIMVTVSWDDLAAWARVAVMAVPGGLGLAVGAALRNTAKPSLVRGGQVAWMVSVALLGGAVATAGANADLEPENTALLAGLVAAAIGAVLWTFAPSHPQVVALGAALGEVAFALGARSDENDLNSAVVGGTLIALGVAGLFLAERRWFVPQLSARGVSALAFAGGAFIAGVESGALEVLAPAAGVALVTLSVRRRTLIYMLVGVAVVFLGLVSTLTRHAGSPTTAAAGLIVLGALMLGVVLVLARWQPWERQNQ
jgi:hypothetical protein